MSCTMFEGQKGYFGILDYLGQKVVMWTRISVFVQSLAPQFVQSYEQF